MSAHPKTDATRPDGDVPVTVIEPKGGWRLIDVKEIYEYRDLFRFLTYRAIRTRYAQSALGVSWAVIQPVATMVVFTIVFGRFISAPSDGAPYAIFSFAALVPWTYFSTALTGGVGALVAEKNIVSKIYFPRIIVPMIPVLARLVDFVIAFIILLVLLAVYVVPMNDGSMLTLANPSNPAAVLIERTGEYDDVTQLVRKNATNPVQLNGAAEAVYVAGTQRFSGILAGYGEATVEASAGATAEAAAPPYTWEYWNGAAWQPLPQTAPKGTPDPGRPAIAEFDVPGDWTRTEVQEFGPYFFLRLTAGGSADGDAGAVPEAVQRLWIKQDIGPNATAFMIPVFVLIMVFTTAGAGLFLSALSVQFRDINFAMTFLVRLLMYAAPVIYPISAVPDWFRTWYAFNPMVGVIEGFRASLLGTIPMPWTYIAQGFAVSVILLIIGALFFRRRERVFADVA